MTTELVPASAEELALIQQQEAEFDDTPLQTPILKIGQALTREVQEGEAEEGEFINTLTGESLGESVQFIIAYYNRGRFAADKKTRRAYVAFSEEIPESWADLVGEEFVGTPFSEYPDAEEQFKARVNAKEIEWGNGPLISTTHNYTGFVIVPGEEGSDEPDELQPVRLSLQRTNMPAVRKLNTLKRAMLRNKPFWDVVFELSSAKKAFAAGPAYLLNVKPGRKTSADEREEAKNLALAVAAGNVTSNEDAEVEAPAEAPENKGGLSV